MKMTPHGWTRAAWSNRLGFISGFSLAKIAKSAKVQLQMESSLRALRSWREIISCAVFKSPDRKWHCSWSAAIPLPLFNIGVISRPGAARPRAELDGVTPVPPFLWGHRPPNRLGTSPTMTGSSARGRAAPGYGKMSLLLKTPLTFKIQHSKFDICFGVV